MGTATGNEFIEVINPKVTLGKFKHALFDFDGTISILREGWPQVMEDVMVGMICNGQPPTEEIVDTVRDYIDETTGILTILQMEGLVELIKKFGCVPKGKILSALDYKKVYLDKLMVPVNKRIAQVESGAKKVEDYVVRGSREFVKALRDRGLKLYVASGTDIEYVRHEAEVVGVAQYFNGGIYGAVKGVREDTKEKIIRDIIADHKLHGSELLIVGDGPVEIRCARDNGAVGLGVASDEKTGVGMNTHKRKRLLKAGSDILIPDFSRYEELLRFLFPEGK